MSDQTSRLYVHAHGRPRRRDGSFEPGYTLYTRGDGASRWLRFFADVDDDEPPLLSEQAERILAHLIVLVVAACVILLAR